MPTKIRLQRQGKKRSAFYHIVIADSRAPRDGKFIEKIGTYNPNTNPATIDLSFDKALNWVKTGAQPTETVRAILSYEGVLFKNHLDIGVTKGAFSEGEATKRFDVWKSEKLNKIQKKIEGLSKLSTDEINAQIKAEEEVNQKREAAILAKTSALADEARAAVEKAEAEVVEAAATASAEAAPATEAPTAEVEAPATEVEAPATEESKVEAPAAEVEAPAAEEPKVEAPVAEVEAPVAEEKAEEAKEVDKSEEKAS
jgi:small subunit ribosomal protein S16